MDIVINNLMKKGVLWKIFQNCDNKLFNSIIDIFYK